MVMSVEARAGDIMGSNERYSKGDMYMKHEDIGLRLEGDDKVIRYQHIYYG
jgi:hypothetical protein